MKNWNNGDFVGYQGKIMVVRLGRGEQEHLRGYLLCEWTDAESGDIGHDWFNPNELCALDAGGNITKNW